jgi:hypothetical protein
MSRPVDRGSPVPELELTKNFPGLDGNGSDDGPYVEHTRVREIIGQLGRDLESLRGSAPASMSATWSGPGTVGEVAGLGNVGPGETGQWEVAQSFGSNTEQAYTVFGGAYGSLIDHVEKWVAGVERAVANYEKSHRDSSA